MNLEDSLENAKFVPHQLNFDWSMSPKNTYFFPNQSCVLDQFANYFHLRYMVIVQPD